MLMITGLANAAFAGETSAPTLVIPEWAGDSCVEPTSVMRRDHMRFLFEQRDATVHQGIRTERHSLTGCVQCHVNRDRAGVALAVNATGQFCASCHEYAGVSMDCFDCHATTPD